jgi:hypothetical protein
VSAEPSSIAGLSRVSLFLLAVFANACDSQVVVGSWPCGTAPDAGPVSGDGGALASDPVPLPFTSGFERGLCDYTQAGGFCYTNADASYRIVRSPVHSGSAAMAFSVTADAQRDGLQSRCALEGTLPADATYGAWFYVPSLVTNADNWNLMHFEGDEPATEDGIWDVSLANTPNGGLAPYVFDFLRGVVRTPDPVIEIPIGAWFQLEFRVRRAPDATGTVSLRQDGTTVLELTGIATDDSTLGQWYVGNLANALTPADSTIYVDDVTIRAAP